MTTERLNGLALMHIHPDRLAKIMDESILKSFVEAQPRRMEFGRIENPFIAIFVLLFQFYFFLPLSLWNIFICQRII